MTFKQLLLTSTAVLMLGTPVAPLFAQSGSSGFAVAQAAPPALSGAIRTYLEAQAALEAAEQGGGDVAAAESALATAEQELTALCSAIGQPDIEACIAMFEGSGAQAPAVPEAETAIEAEGEVEPDAEAPAEESVQPAEEPALIDEPAPVEDPAPIEDPAPNEDLAPVEDVAPAQDSAPVEEPAPTPELEEPAPAPEPAPQPQEAQDPAPEVVDESDTQPTPLPAPAEEPEPTTAPEDVTEAPVPVERPAAAPETGQSNAPAALLAAIADYQAAVAEYEAAAAAGGDVTAAAQAVADAEAELRDICQALGQTDLEACLATFELDVDIIDLEAAVEQDDPVEPAAPELEEPADSPVDELPADADMNDDIVLEGDVQGEIVPEGVDAETVAPLLDSEKDAAAGLLEDEPQDAQPEIEPEVETGVEAEAEADAAGAADVEPEVTEEPAEQPQAPEQIDISAIPSIEEEQAQSRQEIAIEEIEQAAEAAATATLNQTPAQQQTGQQGGVLVGPVREGPSNAEIIATIGLATIFAIGANQFINTPDTPRIVYPDDRQYYYEELTDGRTREVILRADGSRIVTVRDRYGDIIRRSRIEPDGREILLVYVDPNYRRYDEQGRWIDPGRQLPPLRLTIPAREYVLDASMADQRQVASFLDQPPVETIQRYYTIDEVKRSSRLRDMVRRLEIGDLTFDTGSANISQSEINTLSAVANAMLTLIERNPAETFLIEGHTDAVGSDLSNLALSDRRAEAVAYALTRVYGIPAENLATQGYGERYLKINTQAAERLNRRVTIRRITPLITPMNAPAG